MTPTRPIHRAIILAFGFAFLAGCADPSSSIERKMSEIRREQCDPLPTARQRAACIKQVNEIEDDALRRLDDARRQQVIQQAVGEMRVINQNGQGW